jgi:uncharacterized protein YsxB (DUF464 family)
MKLDKSSEAKGRAGELIAKGFAGPARSGVDIVCSGEIY